MAFERADRLSLHEEVDKAMQRLPTREQDVLRNVFLKECTAAETASRMEVSTAYVYQLEKGIRRLRGCYPGCSTTENRKRDENRRTEKKLKEI